jgi:hypothetical protein
MTPSKIAEDQSFAISLLYRALGVSLSGRGEEFESIAELIPTSLKRAHGLINDELAKCWRSGELNNVQRCRFKAGHPIVRYESYPKSLSIETVRKALINYGWRLPRHRTA